MENLRVDPGYRIKKPKTHNVYEQIIAKLFVDAYKDLLSNNKIIKKEAIIFFSDQLCDEYASAIDKTGDAAYEQARKVLTGEIDLKLLRCDKD